MSFSRHIQNIFRIVQRKMSRDPGNIFSFSSVLEKNYPPGSSFSVILVGANDGISHDNLFSFLQKRNCTGIAFEPDSFSFGKLVENFKIFPGIKLVNKAIHDKLKEMVLYKVDPAKLDKLPEWASGIGSLDPDHHLRSGIPGDTIIEETVKAGRLMDLLRDDYNETAVDLLQVDVEGYDHEIIRQVDFNKLQPLIIRFEYANLSEEDTVTVIRLLKQNGYYCFYEDTDVVAVKKRQVKL